MAGFEWHIVPSGTTWVDPGGPFGLVPRPLWSRYQSTNQQDQVAMCMHCLLIFSDGKTIVVDNGLGDKLNDKAIRQWGLEYPEGTLLQNLAKHGVRPEDVDIVINTHLHADHCSGNTTLKDGQPVAAFPNAEYWVQRLEFADAMHPNERTRATYLPENFVPIWQAGQLRLLNGDTQVTPDLRLAVTPGHTRGLQVVVLEGGTRPAVYLNDLASFAVHFERKAWVTAYDVEPLETIRTKGFWQRWALENQALLVFEHDTVIPVGELIQDEEGKLKVTQAQL
ncbi:MAG: MBL fold metallo-hydrolase [Anaerolineales bacterium]|nr:MBL fold metallo-hydrolase [Anaerolineales bacterium]MCW5854622.1 MBL fold metallo-hydrolase [Anaerolineales bacterium]